MSSSTWTPAALSSKARALGGLCWRMVEAQHHVSTLKLVDTLDEQKLLEELIEATKPSVPAECRHLDYLLFTPFRYGAYPTGSRFRRAGWTEGVFYGAEMPESAVAEMAFHRLLFFAESPDTPWPANPAEYTAFAAQYATRCALDLTEKPLSSHAAQWSHPTDYSHCQTLADNARLATIDVIRYRSARDPGKGFNLALLSCRVFTKAKPIKRQTWRLHLDASGAKAIREAPRSGIAFDRQAFAADPRIAVLRWER
jgi:hypothetical protein